MGTMALDLLVGSRESLPRISSTLQCYNDWKTSEVQSLSQHGGKHFAPQRLEYETLALRCDPPNVLVEQREECTSVCIDSANHSGILVEVVQHFTELGLNVTKCVCSSESSWVVDVFEIQEVGGGPVLDQRKLDSISQMLNINFGLEEELVPNSDETDDVHRIETTVFELSGLDSPGLLAEVTQLLTTNGCNVRSAAVWTYASRVAFVLSVTKDGQPIADGIKLQRLRELLLVMMSADGRGTVDIKTVRGEVHHDRRLHQLMLAEASFRYDLQAATSGSPPSLSSTASLSDSAGSMHSDLACAALSDADSFRSPKHCRPDVDITYCSRSRYWMVDIKAKDRSKLLFDTVCTLADCGYEVFHATIESTATGLAHQEFYVRPRGGNTAFNEAAAAKLRAMLEASVQRRFPKGLKVHVHSVDRYGCLTALTRVLRDASLSVTRAKVKTYAVNSSSGHTFYVMNADGSPPERAVVEEACQRVGGHLIDAGEEALSCSPVEGARLAAGHKFSFSILSRQWQTNWKGSPGGSSPSSTEPSHPQSGSLACN